jgi:hypothetical protein
VRLRRVGLSLVVSLLAAGCGGIGGARSASVRERLEPVSEASRARGPLRVLSGNPRFLTDGAGDVVFLVGAHTWNNFQDWGNADPPPALDYAQYLRFLRERGHNFTRLWTWEQAAWLPWETGPIRISPLPYPRTGPGLARDGRPRFDLRRFDEAYFARLRDRVRAAGDAGIYVSVMLFNGWSLSPKGKPAGNPWAGHPFNRDNNASGIDGDPDRDGSGTEVQTLLMPVVTELQKAYVAKVADTLNDCDNVIWEISNESEAASREWQYEMIRFLRSHEGSRPRQHLIGMTVAYPNGANDDLLAGPADWISPNAPAARPYALFPAGAPAKVVINDTDHIWGIGGSSAFVWGSLSRGMNALFMDPYKSPVQDNEPVLGGLLDASAYRDAPPLPEWEGLRSGLGQARAMARRCRLATMVPADELVSARSSCLADRGREYLVYVPGSTGIRRVVAQWLPRLAPATVTVDLSGPPVEYSVEWLEPETGILHASGRVAGGRRASLTAPFAGEAVLHLAAERDRRAAAAAAVASGW